MRYLPFFILVAALIGCVQTEATRLASAPDDLPPNVDTSEVAVYADTSAVGCDYDPVAMINAEGSTSSVSDEKMIEKSKVTAAKQGANAIVLGSMDTDDPEYNPLMFGGSDYGSRQGRFLALYERRPCE